MKRLLSILLLAAALVASPAVGQTIKSLGYNTTNGRVIYSNTNPLTLTNSVNFGFPNESSPAFGVPVEIYGTLNINAADDGSGGEAMPSLTVGAFTANGFTGTNTVTINTVSGISFGGDAAGLTRTNLGLGGTNTATFGNVVLNNDGNLAPAQTADSGDSLMTRELYDERLAVAFGFADPVQADFGTVTLVAGATGTKAAGGFDITTGISNNASAVWNASTSVLYGRKMTGTAAHTANWASRVMVGWWFFRALSTNSEIRLQYGRPFNASTHGPLTARGVGVRIATNSVFFETHDGTNGFETTNAIAVSKNPQLYFAIVQNGVAKFFENTALVATVTNNVPTNGSTDAAFGWVMSISNTSTNSSIMRVLANPGYVIQQ